jgi:hypothetical protein
MRDTPSIPDQEEELIALDDVELVRRAYDLVWEHLADDFEAHDRLFWLLQECFERFAPEVAWAEHVQGVQESYGDDRDGLATELAHHLRARREGARELRQLLG